MSTSLARQGDLWEDLWVDKYFFHVFKHMILRGTAGEMGGNGWLIYCVLKTYANHTTGEIFASQETIAEKSNLSVDTVQRAITKLIEMGFVERKRTGRKNTYLIVENVPIMKTEEKAGAPVAYAQRTYVPQMFAEMVNQLSAFASSGNLPTDRNITINVNVNLINQGENSSLTINNITAESSGNIVDAPSEFVNAYEVIADRLRNINR